MVYDPPRTPNGARRQGELLLSVVPYQTEEAEGELSAAYEYLNCSESIDYLDKRISNPPFSGDPLKDLEPSSANHNAAFPRDVIAMLSFSLCSQSISLADLDCDWEVVCLHFSRSFFDFHCRRRLN